MHFCRKKSWRKPADAKSSSWMKRSSRRSWGCAGPSRWKSSTSADGLRPIISKGWGPSAAASRCLGQSHPDGSKQPHSGLQLWPHRGSRNSRRPHQGARRHRQSTVFSSAWHRKLSSDAPAGCVGSRNKDHPGWMRQHDEPHGSSSSCFAFAKRCAHVKEALWK